MKELIVFDVQKFALHDGPGIRTTIFLKGCPLNCIWCHNPESKRLKPQLGFLAKNCIRCGKCQQICQNHVHMLKKNDVHEITFENCIQCGMCESVCPNHALKIYGKPMNAKEILSNICRDKDFFDRSGGGITISGGEPMMQFEALLDFVKKAKEKGLHICLDTCGYSQTEKYRYISEYVDLFLFDYKITEESEHQKYTGVSNTLILKNLDYLCRNGNDVFLRCPIIPGINDNEKHYLAIAELSKKYSNIRQVNLMAYHDMAKGKATQIGETYPLEYLKTIEKKEREKINQTVRNLGCLKLSES